EHVLLFFLLGVDGGLVPARKDHGGHDDDDQDNTDHRQCDNGTAAPALWRWAIGRVDGPLARRSSRRRSRRHGSAATGNRPARTSRTTAYRRRRSANLHHGATLGALKLHARL